MKYFKDYLHYKLKAGMRGHRFQSPMLEVGCGTGETLELLSRQHDVKGIDPSKKAVAACKKKGLNVENTGLFGIKKKFDSVICIDVIEHIKDDHAFIAHIYKVLNKNGKLFILAPCGKMMKDDILYGHFRRYSRHSFTELLKDHKFDVEAVEMFGYPILHFLRLFMNSVSKLSVKDSKNLKLNTLKSSYDNPFDNTIYSKILHVSLISKLLSKILLLQNFFKNGTKGLAVIAIAKKVMS